MELFVLPEFPEFEVLPVLVDGLDVLGFGAGAVVGAGVLFEGEGLDVAVFDGDGDGLADADGLLEADPDGDGEDEADGEEDDPDELEPLSDPDDGDPLPESDDPPADSLESAPESVLVSASSCAGCAGPTAMICVTGIAVVCEEMSVSLSLTPSTYVTL